jgi:hypothetical protein
MSESELLERMFDAIAGVLAVFSIFFTIVSGYLAALYLFLATAPLLLRVVAFALLSIGLAFLGGTAAVIQKLQDALFIAWGKLPSPSLDLAVLRNPIPIPANSWLPFEQQQFGVAIGWLAAFSVYLVLAYLTFVYRWPREGT